MRDDPIVNLVAGETWQAEPCPSLRNEEVRRPDHERHEECSEGQRGHPEDRQGDVAIWKEMFTLFSVPTKCQNVLGECNKP